MKEHIHLYHGEKFGENPKKSFSKIKLFRTKIIQQTFANEILYSKITKIMKTTKANLNI